jgi:hypothetical protein
MESCSKVLKIALDGLFPIPDIGITEYKGIDLEWENEPRKLTFHIHSDGCITYERSRDYIYEWHMMEKIHRFGSWTD